MILTLILISQCIQIPISVEANWNETSYKDEVMLYLKQFGMDNEKNNQKIKSLKEDTGINTIVSSMSKILYSNMINDLNMSLHYRLFHPKAAVKTKIHRRAKMLGWGAFCKKNSTDSPISSDFHLRIITFLAKLNFPGEKILFMKELLNGFNEYYDYLKNLPINQEEVNKFRLNKVNEYPYTLINGRQVSNDQLKIINTIHQEFKLSDLLGRVLRMPPISIKNIIQSRSYDEVYNYISPPPNDYGCILLDPSSKKRPKEISKFDLRTLYSFFDVNSKMLKIDFFIDLNSPESTPLLEIALKLEKKEQNMQVRVFPIINLNNRTELEIGLGFLYLKLLNPRAPVAFLSDCLKTHHFETSFQKSHPGCRLSDLNEKEYALQFECLKNLSLYISEKNIKPSMSLNGHFIEGNSSFIFANDEIAKMQQYLFTQGRREVITPQTNFTEWIPRNGVSTKKAQPPLEMDEKLIIRFDDLSVADCNIIINMVIESKTISKGNFDAAVVAFVGWDGLKIEKETPTSYLIDQKFWNEMRQILNIETKEATIVFPYVFERKLTEEQLEYASGYVRRQFFFNINALPVEQMIAIALYRGADFLRRTIRYPMEFSYALLHAHPEHPVQMYMRMDPFAEDAPGLINTAFDVASMGSCGVALIPTFRKTGNVSLHSYLFNRRFVTPDKDGIAMCDKDQDIRLWYPSESWGVSKLSDNRFIVKTVPFTGYSPKARRFDLDGEIYGTNNNGFFALAKPIGNYGEIQIDSFIPSGKVYKNLTESDIQKKYEKTRIVVINDNTDSSQFSTYLNSMIKDKTYVYVMTSYPIENLSKVEPIPNIYPPYMDSDFNFESRKMIRKILIAPIIIPISQNPIIICDGNFKWKADPSLISTVDLKNAAIGAPLLSQPSFIKKKRFTSWFGNVALNERMQRPFHKSDMLIFNQDIWISSKGSNVFERLMKNCLYSGKAIEDPDGLISFNKVQLFSQYITLSQVHTKNILRSSDL